MTSAATIFQCSVCLRYFIDGNMVSLSVGEQAAAAMSGQIVSLADCGQGDCAAIKTARVKKDADFLKRFHRSGRHLERHQGKAICRSLSSGHTEEPPAAGRLPCPKDTEFLEEAMPLPEPVPLTQSVGSLVALTQSAQSAPGLLSPGARQAAYIASGAGAKTDARVRDFLMADQNFGKWFSRKFLKEIAQNDLLNNIADRLRDELRPQGFYVDNCMMAVSELAPKSSHYRICRLQDAISLSAAEKAAAGGVGRNAPDANE